MAYFYLCDRYELFYVDGNAGLFLKRGRVEYFGDRCCGYCFRMAKMSIDREFNVIDLFSGCGGLTEGLHQVEMGGAKFRTLAAVDIWPAACDTLEENHPEVNVFRKGLTPSLIQELKRSFGPNGIDLIVGGPPCQGFSSSGKRALEDPRNNLVKMYLQSIKELQPKAFLMENVVGFTTFQSGKICLDVIEKAKRLGYSVFPAILQASLYGVPQRRRRFVLAGVQTGPFAWPDFVDANTGRTVKGELTKFWPAERQAHDLYTQDIPSEFRELTFREATMDLPPLAAGKSSSKYRKLSNELNWFIKHVRENPNSEFGLLGHESSKHAEHLIAMMSELSQGQSAFERFEIGHKLRPTSGFSNSYTRIHGNRPAPTITRNFTTPSSANCIHPYQARALSPREGARLQSFSDNYSFCGTSTEQRLQIGNAVPPLLAKALGTAVLKNLMSQQ